VIHTLVITFVLRLDVVESFKWRLAISFANQPQSVTSNYTILSILGAPKAEFEADPFLVPAGHVDQSCMFLFYESYGSHPPKQPRGEIDVAKSCDVGKTWMYQGTALKRPYHLSYPHIHWSAKHNVYVMVPETHERQCVQVFITRPGLFPFGWTLLRELLCGRSVLDTSFVYFRGSWVLFAGIGGSMDVYLEVYTATDVVTGVWHSHPANPVSTNRKFSRPAGRPYVVNGTLYRWAQDNSVRYGAAVHSLAINLNKTHYAESPQFVLRPCALCVFKTNLHHVDFQELHAGSYIAVLDGF
jgi:hypothetical protein